ncbi:MAG: class I adenylate-forming enzyme family protein [Candidatus Binatia bacterium]|jgi:acyl-CoA synthetase (AMP-forming)/AMP-acid ligase II
MKDLYELVEQHAASAPKTAVARWILGRGFVETSYAELLRTATKFAAHFARHTAPRAIIPMVVGKTADSIAAMLGALATGRAFCFINPKYRGPQIATVLAATGARTCIIDAAGLTALRGAWAAYPAFARPTWLCTGADQLTRLSAASADDLRRTASVIVLEEETPSGECRIEGQQTDTNTAATCLFTSGSTGEPKGVLISREDLMRRVAAEIDWFNLTCDDVLLSILPFSFDVGLNQLLTALTVGAELVVLDSWLPSDILSAAEARRVTGISGVPAIWQEMVNAGLGFDKQARHAALRYITISGGSLPTSQLERLGEHANGVGIFKTYGQTEAFRATSLRPEEYQRKRESVGRPLAGVRVYVVSEDGTRCGPGEVGEVVHTGLGVMLGYLGNSDTNAKLRANPFYGDEDPSRLAIFTGDMGYLDAEGYLYLKGRADRMLKVMGNRVYPQEITNQILAIAGVKEALVAGITRELEQAAVIAFVAVAPGAEVSAGAVRKVLREKLPSFMIPQEIVLVHQMPRTANGKLDERRLVEEYAARQAAPAGAPH